MIEKEFKKAYQELRNKHIEEDEELLKELKRTGKFEKGLDGNHEDFKRLHQKQQKEIKKLCDKFNINI